MKSILKEGDPDKITRVEEQILEIWDRVYQSWVSGHFGGQAVGPQVDGAAVQDSWDSFVNDVTFTPGKVFSKKLPTGSSFTKQNSMFRLDFFLFSRYIRLSQMEKSSQGPLSLLKDF